MLPRGIAPLTAPTVPTMSTPRGPQMLDGTRPRGSPLKYSQNHVPSVEPPQREMGVACTWCVPGPGASIIGAGFVRLHGPGIAWGVTGLDNLSKRIKLLTIVKYNCHGYDIVVI
jgi:hypothetical protein